VHGRRTRKLIKTWSATRSFPSHRGFFLFSFLSLKTLDIHTRHPVSPPTLTEQRVVCVFRSEIGPERLQKLGGSTNLLEEGLNFMDAEDAEELEFLLN
jgi:hypothetical protein